MADKTARDVMSPDVTCVGENESLLDAARKLAELDVGALPICGEDDRLKGCSPTVTSSSRRWLRGRI